MKKAVKVIVCILLIISISGCKNKVKKDNEESNSNSNSNIIKLNEVDIYDVDYKDKEEEINDNIIAYYNICKLSSKNKDSESKKIENYLNEKVSLQLKEFKDIINIKYVKNNKYIFDYKYSLITQNEKYIIFKLKYKLQTGEPHFIDGTEYYMFDINTGSIIEFDNLFTSDIKEKVYNYVLNYMNKIYEENEMKYDPYEYDLNTNMFFPGYFIFNNDKLSFSFPKSTFAIAAYGSIDIDIDKDIYYDYIK